MTWLQNVAQICLVVEQICRDMEPIIQASVPSMLNSIHFTTFNLGRTPARFEGLIVRGEGIHDTIDIFLDVGLKINHLPEFGVAQLSTNGRLGIDVIHKCAPVGPSQLKPATHFQINKLRRVTRGTRGAGVESHLLDSRDDKVE